VHFKSTYRTWFPRMAVGLAALAIAAPGASAAIPWEAPAPADSASAGTAGLAAAGGEIPGYQGLADRSRALNELHGLGDAAGPAVSSPGIDWRDAGIGGAVGVAAGLVIGASLLLVGRRQDALARV